MFQSHGLLRYSPKLLGDKVSAKWWLVVDCDDEIGRYYRQLYHSHRYFAETLAKPAWQEHITVIRDEEPVAELAHYWEQHAGKVITFEYDPVPKTNGIYWWLTVHCDTLLDMRVQLGLPRDPEFPLHLSFGHEGQQ